MWVQVPLVVPIGYKQGSFIVWIKFKCKNCDGFRLYPIDIHL